MNFWVYSAVWTLIMVSVIALFALVEMYASCKARRYIDNWLRKYDPVINVTELSRTIAQVFDSIFGEKYLSWRCFYKSCIASFISFVIVFTIWGIIYRNEIVYLHIYFRNFFKILIMVFSTLFFNNFLFGYFSLLKTRKIIEFMSKTNSFMAMICFLIADFALTLSIFIIGFILFSKGFRHLYILSLENGILVEFMEDMKMYLGSLFEFGARQDKATYPFNNIFILWLPTFFPSIWIWLYAISSFVVKDFNFLGVRAQGIRSFLHIDRKPILCVGVIACVVVTIIFLLAAPWVLI